MGFVGLGYSVGRGRAELGRSQHYCSLYTAIIMRRYERVSTLLTFNRPVED